MRKVAIAALAVLALGYRRRAGNCQPPGGQPAGQQLRDRHERQPEGRRPGAVDRLGERQRDRAERRADRRDDDSYSGGAKEDDRCPGTTTGSIPNNKSDLLTFGGTSSRRRAARVPELVLDARAGASGTTLMDFELNQSSTDCGNGVNPVRTAGDLLIEYRIEQGGAAANIRSALDRTRRGEPASDLHRPRAAQRGRHDQHDADPGGRVRRAGPALGPRTFGEAQLDLDFIFDEGRVRVLRQRVPEEPRLRQLHSQLKDFIAPVPANITNCGTVIIRKQTDPDEDPTTTDFGYTKSFPTDPDREHVHAQDDGVADVQQCPVRHAATRSSRT